MPSRDTSRIGPKGAFYFFNYSTWKGRCGVYLEDLYVSPDYRGRGAGKALIRGLAQVALDNNCQRLEFSVLDWNTPAIDFYRHLGFQQNKGWLPFRADRSVIERLAG